MPKSKFLFLIDGMTWSYSRVSAFETCPYQWKLIYIDKNETQDNYFGQLGTFSHLVFEKFWDGDIDIWSLPEYFEDGYSKAVTMSPPSILERWDFEKKSYGAILNFFQNFDLDLSKHTVIGNEFTIKTKYKGLEFTIRPDTIVRNDNLISLIDYKSGKMYDNKDRLMQKKLVGYKKQLFIYAYFSERELDIKIDQCQLILPKYSLDKTVTMMYTKDKGQEAVDWMVSVIDKIKQENDFKPKVDKFFCQNLCGVRDVCEHWQKNE